MTDKQVYHLGHLLILLGGLTLLAKLGLFNGMPGIIGAAFLALPGVLFSRMYFQRKQLWALLLGFGFFAAAAAAITGELAGAYFLGILGSGFAYAYFRDKSHWWAIIPAGVLATLAIIVGIAVRMPFLAESIAPILFLGLAGTFAYLYLLPEGGKRWAVYPAIAAVVIAILSASFTTGWLLPAVLVGAGIYLLNRNRKAYESEVRSQKDTNDTREVSEAASEMSG